MLILKATQIHQLQHSLSRVVEGFLLKCKLEDLTPQTIETHRLKLERFVYFCGDCFLCDVAPVFIREFLGYVKDKYDLDIVTRIFLTTIGDQ